MLGRSRPFVAAFNAAGQQPGRVQKHYRTLSAAQPPLGEHALYCFFLPLIGPFACSTPAVAPCHPSHTMQMVLSTSCRRFSAL